MLDATRSLIADGIPVTVQRAADEAGISKATAYRYFSDPSLLVAEAGLALEVAPYEDVVAGCDTPRARALAVSLYIFDLSVAHEAAFRNFLARNLDAWAAENGAPRQRRGARRVQMFRAALQDAGLPEPELDALVTALTLATGSEAMIALFDIARTDPDTARATVALVAEALLDRFLPGT
ncbi:hypothetical protein ATO3_16495 [Marinibacterium profundimaris]|uniref:HTH tetR-type domain-containing protein n=1 Tax=Marinibacterium profundimaris TaxID=1679460 RepID=A0A225NL18_9RHOB|nr:hypothetical protein ATO3_16495 [Marinibacterium profundimaris]